ncbi:MAG: ABC transporter ATP-binding protein [Anaerolineae bacterium]|jgi:ABC-2 type transport system ATP-binding protein
MIETRGLTRRFESFTAVDHVDLSVAPGEVFGFLGPNGAGKTTTIRMLAALIGISEGEAWVAGFKVGEQNDEVRRRIGILTESPGLYDRISVEGNLRFFARLHLLDREQEDRQVDKYLSLLGLQAKRKEPAATLSKGMKQKLALARAMLHEPEVLFLDEPTSGLDPEASRVVREFMAELGAGGRTIILCTHNLFEADLLCQRIGIIKQRLLRVDTPAGLRASLYGQKVTVELAEPAPGLAEEIRALPFVTSVETNHASITVELKDPDHNNPALINRLVGVGAQVRYVRPVEHSLEDAYLALVSEGRQ